MTDLETTIQSRHSEAILSDQHWLVCIAECGCLLTLSCSVDQASQLCCAPFGPTYYFLFLWWIHVACFLMKDDARREWNFMTLLDMKSTCLKIYYRTWKAYFLHGAGRETFIIDDAVKCIQAFFQLGLNRHLVLYCPQGTNFSLGHLLSESFHLLTPWCRPLCRWLLI